MCNMHQKVINLSHIYYVIIYLFTFVLRRMKIYKVQFGSTFEAGHIRLNYDIAAILNRTYKQFADIDTRFNETRWQPSAFRKENLDSVSSSGRGSGIVALNHIGSTSKEIKVADLQVHFKY